MPRFGRQARRRAPDRSGRIALDERRQAQKKGGMPRPMLLLLLASTPAFAQATPDYRDDRTDAAAIVSSYYNAIARQEYARAWGYFGETRPVATFEAFVSGYADTTSIALKLGPVSAEGAAGSLYESVPVAFAATGHDGKVQVFAGCYTTRLLQPANQEPPFAPLHIEKASLHETTAPLEAALPATCD